MRLSTRPVEKSRTAPIKHERSRFLQTISCSLLQAHSLTPKQRLGTPRILKPSASADDQQHQARHAGCRFSQDPHFNPQNLLETPWHLTVARARPVLSAEQAGGTLRAAGVSRGKRPPTRFFNAAIARAGRTCQKSHLKHSARRTAGLVSGIGLDRRLCQSYNLINRMIEVNERINHQAKHDTKDRILDASRAPFRPARLRRHLPPH